MNKKDNIIKTIMIILFVCYIGIYISNKDGYNEYNSHKRVELTNEQIKKFEQDVKDNKNIDINDYINDDMDDYSNGISNASLAFSNITGKYIRKSINDIFNMISKFMS